MPKPSQKRKAAWEEMMKQAIFEATVSVMKEHGAAGIRMDLVARAADMATGTLYNYFKDKEALLLHVIETLFIPYHAELNAIRTSDLNPLDKLVAYFRLTCRSLNEQMDIVTILLQAKELGVTPDTGRDPEGDIKRTIITFIGEIIEEGIGTGAFRKCNALGTAAMILGAIDGFIEAKIREFISDMSVEEEVSFCKALILPGLLAAT